MDPEKIRERPVWMLLSSHWVSLLGAGLLITAIVSWLLILPQKVRGGGENPYLGILTLGVIPLLFFGGLALIPLGLHLARKQIREKAAATPVEERKAIGMRLAKFFAIVTGINLLIGTQITLKAVHHMESVQFCGATCHSMNLHLAAYGESPHQEVACVECHVAPGFKGFVASKVSGTRQLWETITNSYPRPVQSAIETGRMVASNVTCEQCHSSQKFSGALLRVRPKYQEDESNTETFTVLMNLVGGGYLGGIHGRHFGQGVEISYYAEDPARSTVSWVQYRNSNTGEVREYSPDGGKSGPPAAKVTMQCVDCHNRPAHTFDSPERAVDRAIARGHISASLPYVKKKGVEILRAGYATGAEADQKIGEAVQAYYRTNHPDVASKEAAKVEAAAKSLRHIYSVNVSPEMKTDWGTYTNQLGHTDFPGCFRCHGGELTTKDGKMINDDCSVCHEMLAVEEKNPEILGKLGLEHRLDELKNRQLQ
jgi:nitrate/TMAO reductase-like tetraheme cytochrome c subunit